MRTIYIAEDGTQFDDALSCENHEWQLAHPHIKDVLIFGEDGHAFTDIYSMDTYCNAVRIVVPNAEAAKDLRELGEYTGFECYKDIDSPGLWRFDELQETFCIDATRKG